MCSFPYDDRNGLCENRIVGKTPAPTERHMKSAQLRILYSLGSLRSETRPIQLIVRNNHHVRSNCHQRNPWRAERGN